MSRATNYLRWQFRLIKPYVEGNVLEIGAGIGNFTPELSRRASHVTSVEPDPYCYQHLERTAAKTNNVVTLKACAEDLATILDRGFKADTIVCLNVLEHIQDDLKMLKMCSGLLRRNGILALQVPACPRVFGKIDAMLGHYRRYTRSRIVSAVRQTSLVVEHVQYMNIVGLLGWWWNSRRGRIAQSDGQIRVFDKLVVPILSRIEAIVPMPIGQSLTVVSRKRERKEADE